ncbi:MAG: HAD-IA family hydrolase [Alistipes sp.]|nr:HAD-IA family hydrolase [Alistipes sp.]
MATRLVIFDLDGTLLNTIGDLAEAANRMLAERNLPQHDYATYRTFVGNGISRLVERALPEAMRSTEELAAARNEFLAYYIEHIDCKSCPYEGIPALLATLQERGIQMAVASNKFQEGTERLVRSFFPTIHFETVFGQRPEVPLKPDPAVVNEILSLTAIDPSEALYVGDSGVDMRTARAAGVRSVGVSWGFRQRAELIEQGADHLIDGAEELLGLL